MRTSARPLTALLLGLLVLSWAPCPGTVARLFADLDGATAPTIASCGCEYCREDAPEPRLPGDEDCPYCAVSGGKPDALLADRPPDLDPPAPAEWVHSCGAPSGAPDVTQVPLAVWEAGHGPPPDPAGGVLALLL